MADDGGDDHALILQISADNSKMLRSFETAVSKIDGYASILEARGKKAGTALEQAFAAPNLGKGLDAVFSSTRNQIMAEATSQVGGFASALGFLGPVGLVAGAGLAAFTATMDRAGKAVDFAANVAKLSTEVGVSTDFIQKFNFAAHQNDIDIGAADESLKKFNVTLGLVKTGLARKQAVNAFKEVGFTPEQLKQFHDAGDLFPVIADRIAKMGDAAAQAAVAKRLGLEDLLVMLKGGASGFNALAKEAADLGIVMDAATVQKAADAKQKLSELDDVMKAKSMITFAQFADLLIEVKEAFLTMEEIALSVLSNIENGVNGLIHPLQTVELLLGGIGTVRALNPGGNTFDARAAQAQASQLMNAQAGLHIGEPAYKAAPTVKTGGARKGGSKADDTGHFDKSAQDAYEEGLKALIGAQAALLLDLQARANAEKAAVDAETAKKLVDLNAEEAKIGKAKGDAHKAEQLALLDKAKTEEQNAAAARKELIDRQAGEAIRLKALELTETGLDGQTAALEQQKELTFNEQTRARIALQLVDIAYQKTKAELEGLIASKSTSDADKKIAQLKLAQLNALQAGKVDQAQRSGSAPASQANSIVAGVSNQQNAAKDAAAMYAEIDRLRQQDVISERVAAQAKAQVNAQYSQQRLQNAQQFFGDLATLTQSSNAVLHDIGKVAAVAQATIDGILAVQKALASAPPPWNFALAAAAGAAAAVNVAKIAGLKEGGRVGGSGGPDSQLRYLSPDEHVIKEGPANRNRPLLDAINAGADVSKLLSAPQVPAGARAAPPVATGSRDIHIHPTWHITNPDPDLQRLVAAQPRVLKRTIQGMIANREIDFLG